MDKKIKSNISIANHKYIKKHYSILGLGLIVVMLVTINLLSGASSNKETNTDNYKENLNIDNNSLKDLLSSLSSSIENQEVSKASSNNDANQNPLAKPYFSEFDNQYNDGIQSRLKSDMLVYQSSKATENSDNANKAYIKVNKIKNLDNKILQGKVIAAILETEISSELPGMIRAVIKENVFSETGDNILIPKGSRLIGQYNSDIAMEQSRVFIERSRVITPDGIDISLASPGTDSMGQTGVTGDINNHTVLKYSQAILTSLISIGSQAKANKENHSVKDLYKKNLLENLSTNIQSTVQETMNIKPTITINAGSIVNVFVAKDIDFKLEDI